MNHRAMNRERQMRASIGVVIGCMVLLRRAMKAMMMKAR